MTTLSRKTAAKRQTQNVRPPRQTRPPYRREPRPQKAGGRPAKGARRPFGGRELTSRAAKGKLPRAESLAPAAQGTVPYIARGGFSPLSGPFRSLKTAIETAHFGTMRRKAQWPSGLRLHTRRCDIHGRNVSEREYRSHGASNKIKTQAYRAISLQYVKRNVSNARLTGYTL